MGFILNLIPLIFTDDTDLKDKFLPRIRADQMKVQRFIVFRQDYYPLVQRSRFLGPHGSCNGDLCGVDVRLSERQVVVGALCLTRAVCQREAKRRCKIVLHGLPSRTKPVSRLTQPSWIAALSPSTCYPESRRRALVSDRLRWAILFSKLIAGRAWCGERYERCRPEVDNLNLKTVLSPDQAHSLKHG